jgi:hypothetical protein
MNLFHESNVYIRGSNAVADGTSETTSTVVDMEGFDEVTFAVEFADVDAAAVLTFAVKENTASSVSSPTPTAVTLTTESGSLGDITSGNLVITESSGNLDNKTVLITVSKNALSKRYVFLSITVTVESYELNGITIIKSKARSMPVSQGSTVVGIAYAAS